MVGSCSLGFPLVGKKNHGFRAQILTMYPLFQEGFAEISQNQYHCKFWICTPGVFYVVSAMNALHLCDFVCIHGCIFDCNIWSTLRFANVQGRCFVRYAML